MPVKHNESRKGQWSREYKAWTEMLNRCRNPEHPRWSYYGGRGITVCDRWKVYSNFIADVGRKPTPSHSLDRIDVNGKYEPGNVRWATRETQNRNKRDIAKIEWRGESLCFADWADRLGVPKKVLWDRVRRYGWSVERAFTTPNKPTRVRNVEA